MHKKNLTYVVGLLALLAMVSITMSAQNLVWAAAAINCTPGVCVGTDGDDTIIGTKSNDYINGKLGNDKINGQSGDETICGDGGDDKISGGAGNDWLIGDDFLCKGSAEIGADNLAGGPGNDILVHGHAWTAESDGHKDILDCGPGLDTAYANLSIDHDVVSNCETINPPE